MSDLISRQAVLDAINGTFWSGIEKAINAIPSAETPTISKKHQLSAETPTNTPTDLISRQAAIRKCCGEKCGCEREDCGYTESCSEVSRLEELPSVPDSRQRGEWIPATIIERDGRYIKWVEATEPDDIDGFKCSECGEVFDVVEARYFCPNCGARMYKGGDDE